MNLIDRSGMKWQRKPLSVAVAAALSLMVTLPAKADPPITGATISGGYTWGSGDLSIASTSVLSGGSTGLTAGGASLGTLSNSGSISASWYDVYVSRKTIAAIDNAGSMTAGNTGILNSGGIILSLKNEGFISGDLAAISNSGTIGALINSSSGVIAGGSMNVGIYNMRRIGTLSNSGIISGGMNQVSPPNAYSFGIQNAARGTIDSLNNNSGGTIYGQASGIYNYASSGTALITELNNSGLIDGEGYGIWNDERGGIATLNNLAGGTINSGILNGSSSAAGTIGTLNNAGMIIDASTTIVPLGPYVSSPVDGITAIHNARGAIGTLNNSGLISAVNAIVIDGNATIATLINSGTIAGSIINNSTRAQTISGGTGTVFGTLTGLNGGIGQISNTSSNWVFGSGNQVLNDNINVGANTVVNAAGVVQLDNHIAIAGNYRQNAAAALNVGVGSGAIADGDIGDSGYGRMIVSGSAVIDAGSSVMLKKNGNYRFANGQRYLVIQASAAGTDYNEMALQYGATGFNGKVTGSTIADGGNLDLLLTLDGGTENLATGSNAQSALNGLFNYLGTDQGLMNLFNGAAAANSSDEANRIGSQLSPSSGTAAVAGSSMAISRQINNVAFNRLSNGVPQGGGASSGLATGESMHDGSAWGQAFGGRASDDGRDGVSGYHASYSGLLVGADAALNDRWRAGGLLSHAATSISNDGDNAGSSAHVDSYGLMAYAGYTGEPWYVNMSAGALRSNIDARRAIDFTGFSGIANGSYKGMQYVASVQAGYPFATNGMVVTPLAGLTYSSLKLDGYTETGGNGAALRVDSSSTHSLKSDLGIQLERAYKTSYGLLKPTAQLSWRHEYGNIRLQSVANFAADTPGATSFVTEGPTPVADTGVLSLGLTLLRNDNLTLSVGYTLEQGGGYTSQTGNLLARWRF